MKSFNRSSFVTVAHVYGAETFALTTGHLRSVGIPVFADVPHFSSLYPQYLTAVGGITISVPRSRAASARYLLESAGWETRPLSKLKTVMWIVITLWFSVPPISTAVFVARLSDPNKLIQRALQ